MRIRLHILIGFLCSLLVDIKAQDADYLSIYKDTTKHDTIRYDALYEYIWENIYANTDEAIKYATQILNDPKINEFPQFKSKFFNAAGAVYQVKGNYVKSINYYQEGLKIDERINDLRGQSIKLGNIGSIYLNLENFDMALKFLTKCLTVLNKKDDEMNRASVYNNLSIVYQQEKNFGLATSYCNKAIAIYEKVNDKNSLSFCYNNLANLFELQKDKENSMVYLKKALALANETENIQEVARTYAELGNLSLDMGKDAQAIEYLKKGEKIAEENDLTQGMVEIQLYLFNYYFRHKDYKSALDHYSKHIELREILQKENKQREINRIQLEYEYQKKAEQDSVTMATERALNEEKIKSKNAEISQANTQKVFFIAFIIVLLIVSFVIFNRFRLTRLQKQIIEEKNKQTEEQKLIIEEKQKEIVDSINYAKRIQDSLLDNFEVAKRFFSDSFILLKPKDIVSGDFYWISKRMMDRVSEEKHQSVVTEMFFIAVCDSTGHGVPGGFMSLLNIAYLSEAINEKNILEPNKILDYVRERLINTISKNEQKDGFDGVLMRFDHKMVFENKQLKDSEFILNYSAAYNCPILIKGNTLTELDADKMPVGYGERNENFKNHTINLQKGDSLYVYTDGFADQFGGPKGKKFKYKQLNELLLRIHKKPGSEQQQLLQNEFESWKGELEQIDDVCIIGLKF